MRKRLMSIAIGAMMVIGLVGCSEKTVAIKETTKSDIQQDASKELFNGDSLEIIDPVKTPQETDTPADTIKPTETEKTVETTKPTEGMKGTNQLTDEMNEKVEVFKCYTDQKQRLFTIEATVGGKASIWTSWDNYKIYSQDTGVAKAEGQIIYGVSEGTTYIVVECMSLTEVYKVVVKGVANIEDVGSDNVQLGINQLTDEMNEKVEVFKCYTDQKQRLFTIETTVGGKAAIDTAWSDYKIYSQDTGIAKAEGQIIYGISKGTTYVVVECMSLKEVYKIIVE